jgi:hypothetical protein
LPGIRRRPSPFGTAQNSEAFTDFPRRPPAAF